jgi:Ca2+-binding RTX toxin-like protein
MKRKTLNDLDSIIRTDLALSGDIADASAFAFIAADPGSGPGLPDLATPGETIRGKAVYGFTGDWDAGRAGNNNVMTQLDSGLRQDTSDGVITFAFLNQRHVTGINNNPQLGEGRGYTPFSATQMAAARIAVANWDDLISARIVEITPGPGASTWAKSGVDIWLANTSTGPAQAWAYYPGYTNQYARIAGDVWIADPRFNGSNAQLDPGFYGLNTLNHELGHALGLSHPGDYNFGDDNDGDGIPDPITYAGDAFYYQDNNQYSIMSYFDSYEAGNNQIDWNLMRFVYASTPMVDDVRVVQAKYGADMTTRTGNTTYGFNATADVTNEAMRFHTGEMLTIFTIWDAGGNDTLDLSGYYTNSVIDLREGAYSSAGGFGAYSPAIADSDPSALSQADYLALVNPANAALGFGARTAAYDLYFGGRPGVNESIAWFNIMGKDTLMENNIGIAYGAIVENAIGGYGDDRINGNQANNRFTGGAGADTFVFARYGAGDTSIDTITDFATGVDKIDLTTFHLDGLGRVTIDNANDTVWVDTDMNGTADFKIVVQGSDVALGDLII